MDLWIVPIRSTKKCRIHELGKMPNPNACWKCKIKEAEEEIFLGQKICIKILFCDGWDASRRERYVIW